MFRAMMEGIREETVEQIFANVARFDAAAQRAAEDGTVEAAQAVAKANATTAAGIRVGQANGQGHGTVLGGHRPGVHGAASHLLRAQRVR